MDFSTKQTVTQLIQATWSTMTSLGFSESEINSLQDKFDEILAVVNEKTKSVAPPAQIESVDHERKQRRNKKPNKEKKDQVDAQPVETKAEPEKILKVPRKSRAKVKETEQAK